MTADEIHALVLEALAEVAPDVDASASDADLHDVLGLDSMDLLNLTDLVVTRSGVEIPGHDVAGLRTLRLIEDYLAARTT